MENHQPPVESLTYKELQGLAMALNLPGKMKVSFLFCFLFFFHLFHFYCSRWLISNRVFTIYIQQGVLVEAIKARQNNNEQQVEMILEANRQRRLERRQYQQQQQQQQLSRINGKLISLGALLFKKKHVCIYVVGEMIIISRRQ